MVVRFIPRLLCALILVSLGISKIASGRLPDPVWLGLVVAAVTGLELLLGVLLLSGKFVLSTAIATTAFASALLVVLFSAGRYDLLDDCGCLGMLSPEFGLRVVVAASILSLAALTVWIETGSSSRHPSRRMRRADPDVPAEAPRPNR